MAEDKKPRTNKPIKSWFITYPQSGDTTLESFLEHFSSVWAIQYYKLVKELHEDGNPHIHMILQFKGLRTFSALLGRIKERLPFDWKRIHLQTLKSKADADVYLGKDAKDKLEGGEFETKRKKVIPTPSWIVEAKSKEERETQYDRDIAVARANQIEAEYIESQKFIRHILIKNALELVYPVWSNRLEYAYGDPRLWCREKILKKK